jgi:hypothetical protein
MSQNTKIRLLSYSSTELCDSSNIDILNARPTYRHTDLTGNILRISIGIKANCYNNYYGLLTMKSDTLNLSFLPKGYSPKNVKKNFVIQEGYKPKNEKELKIMFCECYFEMTYAILGISKYPKDIKINGKTIFEAKDIYPSD